MGHTAPDGTLMGLLSTIYALQDQAELAVRLGSPVSHDRRGNVVFFDTFEDGLTKCSQSSTGTGADIALAVAEVWHGAYSVKLVGGSDSSRLALIRYRLPLPVLSKLGGELTFSLDSNVSTIQLDLAYYDGTNLHTAAVLYDTVNDRWSYRDANNVWQVFLTSKTLLESAQAWHFMKLVFDPSADEYVRALVSGQESDLSAYASRSIADASDPVLEVMVTVVSESGENGVAYVDALIVTQNEP